MGEGPAEERVRKNDEASRVPSLGAQTQRVRIWNDIKRYLSEKSKFQNRDASSPFISK
jgi:hypothetical protein